MHDAGRARRVCMMLVGGMLFRSEWHFVVSGHYYYACNLPNNLLQIRAAQILPKNLNLKPGLLLLLAAASLSLWPV